MKIKRLEMIGFKSFVDRTVVTFDHDVLAIVGPNGCGKSNIVDAIRWCMGEQSAKHLRGRSMEDVIFNGSESRAGHSFAEVTLTFDNEDGADLPLEYKDYPEIAVTRRLHRSGESEYLINKTPVRLKDVTDLFLGTGAGTKAYSIVEQGKIGLIVSAKPEDRRMLIEEAAGITKYKSRKRQAERKMELTQQNLLRVGDIVAEIERSLGSLKRQAAKAERYIVYRNELEDLSLYEASHRYLEAIGWIKLETEQVDAATLASDEARSTLAAREAEFEAARHDALAAEERVEKAHNASFAAENEVRAEEACIERARDRIGALGRRAEHATREASEVEEQRVRLASELSAVAGAVGALEEEEGREAAEVAAEQAQRDELAAAQQTAASEVLSLREAIAENVARIASAEATMTGFDLRRADMQARRERLDAELTELEQILGDHEASTEALSQRAEDLRAGRTLGVEEQQRVEARLAELRAEISESDRALDAAKAELARKRSRLQALRELHARHEGVGAGVRALLGANDADVCGLLADRLEAPHELVPALAGLLGSRLQDVVVRDMRRGVDLLEELAREHAGRATVAPLHPRHVTGAHAKLPADPAIVARLVDELRYDAADEDLVHAAVGDAIVVCDRAAAERLRGSWAAPIVTLDGTVVYPDGRVSGGTGEEVAAGMLETKLEARELGEEVARLDVAAASLLERHQGLRASIAEAQVCIEAARHKSHAHELALVTAERDLSASHGKAESVRKRADTVRVEIEDLRLAIAEADGEQERARSVLEEARAATSGRAAGLAAAEARAGELASQLDALRGVLTGHMVGLAGTREKLAAARGTRDRLGRSEAELADRGRRIEEELVDNAAEVGRTAAEVVHHMERRESALDAMRTCADALTRERAAFDALRADMTAREAALKDLRARVDEAREELTKHEMALREQQIALAHLLESVADKFRGLDLTRVVGDYHMRPPPDEETRARIAELLRLIERMGSVNLDAVREHAEAEKRFAFYSEQKADLDKALADLARAIAQMNRESRRLFSETFEAVNQRFQEVFPRMFRGGRASLRLTNPDDLLETGIDILAQPPGKRLSNIELMSGGEKALTAVSLIFAIFQIKPSPFCILDEVDAPLDEANVARYNEAIREMTDRSQFILITHVKRTMQEADVLFGVTMQESGVSRLVSVRVSEAAEMRRPARQPEAAVA